ncbi:MAG: CopG family transcriptional regulator [Boseongicola sp. SB0677_bin_26]|nr:CopG family transcriptional regulator [Boseongicola sp. SB0665_bin_10]MYG27318.1 CopG family transcriptional regulator [Boseongicola sp. SB0677_bin_26]
MTRFVGVANKQPETAWGIWFPDVPGCTSAADSLDDLFPNACLALEFHLEGADVPVPRTAEEIMKFQDVRDDLAGGAVLLMVPPLRAESRKVRMNVTGNAYLVGAIDDAARLRGSTRSALLMQAARREIMGGGAAAV